MVVILADGEIDMKKSLIEKIVNVALHIILLIIFAFGFTYTKFYVGLIFLIIAIMQLMRKQRLWFIVDILLVVFLYFSSGPSKYPEVFYELEQMRFGILQEQYQEEVENILGTFEDSTDFKRAEIGNWLLSTNSEVSYKKSGDSVLIIFVTESRDVNGYAWCSDEVAYGWMETFYIVEELDDNWSMYQIYP